MPWTREGDREGGRERERETWGYMKAVGEIKIQSDVIIF